MSGQRGHRPARRGVVCAVAAATVLAGAPTSVAAPERSTAGTLSWGACKDSALVDVGAECAVVQVPLDHAKPAGRSIPIAISRIKASATGAAYLGPLLSNPGGPGVSGLDDSVDLAALVSPAVAGRFDLIGFDPRGVGESGPDLRCDPAYHARPALDYLPPDPARITGSEQQRLDQARAYVKACAAANGEVLAHLRTIDAARDLDLIRAALGSPTLSYLGNSYGTYLGQIYASRFPTRVARMILTGVVPPHGAGYDGAAADEFNASYLSIACSDGRWPRNYARLRADSLRTAATAPYITWALHWELSALCSSWPSTGAPVPVGAATPSMLLVNGSQDAPTPFADALLTRAAFPHSALIEVTDSLRHAGRSLWGNGCVQGPVERYLLTGELPGRADGVGPDLQCAGMPRPGYPEIALAIAGKSAAPLLPLLDLILGPPR